MDHWDLGTRRQHFIGSPCTTSNECIKIIAQQLQPDDLRNQASSRLGQFSGYSSLCEGVSEDIDRPAKLKWKRPTLCSDERTLDSGLVSVSRQTGNFRVSNDEPQRHPTSSGIWDESYDAIYQSNHTPRHSTIYNKVNSILEN